MEKKDIIDFIRQNLSIEISEDYYSNYGDPSTKITIKLCLVNEKGEKEVISQESF